LAVVAARRLSSRLVFCCSAYALFAVASRVEAQANPAAAPASVPAVLSTRDPGTAFRADGRVSVASITKPAKAAPTAAVNAAVAGAAAPEAMAAIKVHGLTGTLNKGDVHQTMEARQDAFDACIQESRRSVRWVSGAIKYGFRVDAEGRISQLWPVSSTIGHRALEQCLTNAVLDTQFPKPAGRATAEFNWGMSIDSVGPRAFDDPSSKSSKPFARLARKEARDLFGTCEIKRRRARFRVTAYVAAGGKLLSAGAVPQPPTADDKVDCVLEQFGKWHLPKVKHASKISFDVR
jgi:hypothetical protein